MTRIAYLGPEGTFTEEAARRFDSTGQAEFVPVDSPAAALKAVAEGKTDWAVCAIENSVDGAVTTTADALVDTPGVQIYAEADVAAAPERAADLFGLDIHARGVADMETARTRFVLVGKQGKVPAATGNDRTAIVFRTPNKPGTLVGALQEFAVRGVDMSRIESRPTRKEPNTYNFFVDLVGHIDDDPIAQAVAAVGEQATQIRMLGSWPKA